VQTIIMADEAVTKYIFLRSSSNTNTKSLRQTQMSFKNNQNLCFLREWLNIVLPLKTEMAALN